MRIRKNAKVSPLLFSSHASAPEVLQSHVCQLNQSPWDVIPFAQYSFSYQIEGEDSFTGNGSLGDSNIGAVESVSSLMDVGEDPMIINNNNDDIIVKNDNNFMDTQLSNDNELTRLHRASSSSSKNSVGGVLLLCQKNDGKGWQCKKEAKEGYSFCDHHLTLLRSYSHNSNTTPNNNYDTTNTSTKPKSAAMEATGVRRTRGRAAASKKGSSSLNNSTNPYEFYYYSGFGPLWGRKRGERGEVRAATVVAEENSDSSDHSPPPPSSNTSLMDNEELDFIDDEDEDTASGDNGKKRMRKPVKARSLKSLM
ncbi:growth-regulating factor 4 [Humulus lupulus]|uniref:growth-regulating factor 4 n=1 Tax=Humulus lupulus TaxID=3486 RepID=UPI002B40CB94|nr:growth-regulating factor 4 [Humulus lupulus]